MTDNLALELTAGTPSIGSKNDGTTFTWTPTSCTSGGACPINGNTTYNETYGWYYTWYAATSGIGTSSSTGNIDGSICPSGWRLPNVYSNTISKSYGNLTNIYGITVNGANTTSASGFATLINSPLSLLSAGFYTGSTFYRPGYTSGAHTHYWSSFGSGRYGYNFSFNNDSIIWPSNESNVKEYGFNVRCVAL